MWVAAGVAGGGGRGEAEWGKSVLSAPCWYAYIGNFNHASCVSYVSCKSFCQPFSQRILSSLDWLTGCPCTRFALCTCIISWCICLLGLVVISICRLPCGFRRIHSCLRQGHKPGGVTMVFCQLLRPAQKQGGLNSGGEHRQQPIGTS